MIEKVWGVLFEPCQKTICPCLGRVLGGLVLPTAMLEAVLEHFVAVGQGTMKKIEDFKLSYLQKFSELGVEIL